MYERGAPVGDDGEQVLVRQDEALAVLERQQLGGAGCAVQDGDIYFVGGSVTLPLRMHV